jgi:hypothetical protein
MAMVVQVNGYQRPNVKVHQASDKIVRLLAANNPEIAGLIVCGNEVGNNNMNDERAAKIGRAIAGSTHLRKLTINGSLTRCMNLHSYFMWLAHNRSIEDFEMYSFDFSELDFDIALILAPFFALNTNLRRIAILNSRELCESMPSLITLIPKEGNQFVRIDLSHRKIDDKKASDLIIALNAISYGLHNLLGIFLVGNKIGRKACVSLCELLKNPECVLHTLELGCNCLDDESIGFLIHGLAMNKSLKKLDLRFNNAITQTGWQNFFIFLSSRRCLLETILLCGEYGDEGAASLGESLALNPNLKSLIVPFSDFGTSGYHGFSKCLSAPTSALLRLDLSGCVKSDTGAVALFEALVHNTTLKKLKLTNNDLITSTGWATCFRLLADSQSALERLYFDCCEIDDEGATILVDVLSKHLSTVRILDIRFNPPITAVGWRAFTELLSPSSKSKVVTLRIGESCDETVPQINDDVIHEFLVALARNSSLTKFHIGHVNIASPLTLDALTGMLCDKSNITSVCNSNHTLNYFGFTCNGDAQRSNELVAFLELNKGKNKTEVIRKKLLLSSVLDDNTIGIAFGPMPAAVFPSVIEFIGRDRLGYSAMYALIQSFPSLLEYLIEDASGDDSDDADDAVTAEPPTKLRKVEH